jgi:hypothetical protein
MQDGGGADSGRALFLLLSIPDSSMSVKASRRGCDVRDGFIS